ncbi:Maf family protein [Oecophyllibacter saccharovorans]|uniref:Nucleoside triphosphate pyrophosphatase n=1 Tax=Oecophyllibacter saccharovorans TaxID=2558360 RepID=A0A506UKX8_9PROT|nr:nucleoside triphosphate pyrophosphatase [Oecophyllibacter saccharovorans]TPW33980.1 Maf-like protein [Oecophyllibacter saccharovorans]
MSVSSQPSLESVEAVFLPAERPLILASGSAIRRQLLQQAGVPFQVRSVDLDEEKLRQQAQAEGLSIRQTALALAEAKAQQACILAGQALSGAVGGEKPADRALPIVIGADQILECDGQVFNKPATLDEARRQLERLRGRTHLLHTAVTLWEPVQDAPAVTVSSAVQPARRLWSHVETPRLDMRDFSDRVLTRYLEVEGEELLYCVGACKVEGPGAQLFAHMEGSQDAILGLPLLPLLEALRRFGVLPS